MKLTEKNKKIIKNIMIAIFLAYIFILCFSTARGTEFNSAPDEKMKYDVCKYIYNNSKLPHGGEESIRDENYGISYAFMPILSYIISAVFMRLFDIFSTDPFSLIVSARLVSVLCITAYAFMCIKISEKLFKGIYKWVFVAFATLLPQLLYLGSYINNDALAQLSISIIIYSWIIGLEKDWNWKSCIILGVGIGLCSMSYYNAYGYMLTSVILYFVSGFVKKMNTKEFLKKGFAIAGIAILIGGWWFLRSYILYDVDIFAIKIQREYGQEYALEAFKPTNRKTPANQGYSFEYMLKDLNWVGTTKASFIGLFGYMDTFMKGGFYKIYETIGEVALLGLVLGVVIWIIKKIRKNTTVKELILINEVKNKILLDAIFIINIIITIALSLYYSYNMDFQPQGRYIMPMIIPFMYFLTIGIKNIFDTIIKNEKIKNGLLSICIIILAIMAIYISINYVIKPL